MGFCVLFLLCYAVLSIVSRFANISMGEERVGCLTLIALWCHVTVRVLYQLDKEIFHDAVMCYCGIF